MPYQLSIPKLLVVATGASFGSLSAFNIQIDYSFDSNGFFGAGNPSGGSAGGALARGAIEAAAGFFSAILDDDFDAIIPSGSNSWTAQTLNPSGPGNIQIQNLSIAADTVVIYAGGQSLGGDTLGRGSLGGFAGASGNVSWFDNILRRGEQGTTRFSDNPVQPWESSAPNEAAPWGGGLTFDNDNMADSIPGGYTWNFDHTVDPLPGQADFYSLALHEIAHVLGFGTTDSFRTLITGDTPFARMFDGEATVAANGGELVFLEQGLDPPGHFIDGQMSVIFGTDTPQETLLDPTIDLGSREELTSLDAAVFSDIGFNVVPEPSAFTLTLLGFGFALSLRKRRK